MRATAKQIDYVALVRLVYPDAVISRSGTTLLSPATENGKHDGYIVIGYGDNEEECWMCSWNYLSRKMIEKLGE